MNVVEGGMAEFVGVSRQEEAPCFYPSATTH